MKESTITNLKINNNTFLFNVVDDPLERANLKAHQPDVYKRLVQDYEEWQATMLPLDPAAATYSFHSDQMADHYTPETLPTSPGARRVE